MENIDSVDSSPILPYALVRKGVVISIISVGRLIKDPIGEC